MSASSSVGSEDRGLALAGFAEDGMWVEQSGQSKAAV
jgi:hypothetical protein